MDIKTIKSILKTKKDYDTKLESHKEYYEKKLQEIFSEYSTIQVYISSTIIKVTVTREYGDTKRGLEPMIMMSSNQIEE